jgi:hypothetical protein
MRGGREREIERWKKKERDDSKMIREKTSKTDIKTDIKTNR